MKPSVMYANSQGFLLHWAISSDLAEVDAVCLELRKFFTGLGLKDGFFGPELLAREFLNNAVLHGNLGQAEKQVTITIRVGRRWIRIRITDEGSGFNWRELRNRQPEETSTQFRGLPIGSIYADRIKYNRQGNEVTIQLDRKGKAERNQASLAGP
jgi:serine/threonine-protein kinase RsbW